MSSARLRVGVVAALILVGCNSGGGTADTDSEATGTGPVIDRPAPAFIEPASGALRIATNRTNDVSLRVAEVFPGLTTLVADGVSVGTLIPPTEVGALSAEHLTLRITGALVTGRHAIYLATPGAEGQLGSQEIAVNVEATVPAVLTASLNDAEIPATGISASGVGARGLLVAVDFGAETGQVLRASGTGWDATGATPVQLPGLAPAPAESTPAVTAAVMPDGDRLRLAWRVGVPGVRIDVRDVDFGTGAGPPPIPALELDAALTAGSQFAYFGRPVLAGPNLLAELTRPADIEQPRPGDRALIHVRLLASGPGRPAAASFGPTADVDRLGPAIDLAGDALGEGLGVTVRTDGIRPAVIEVDADSGSLRLRSSVIDLDFPSLRTVTGPLTSVVGAFASRTVFGLTGGELIVLSLDDHSNAGGLVTRPSGLPAAIPRGLAVGVIAGAPIALVPYGGDAPVHVVAATAPNLSAAPLDSLECDAVALPATLAANEDAVLGVACLRDGTLRLGSIRVVER